MQENTNTEDESKIYKFKSGAAPSAKKLSGPDELAKDKTRCPEMRGPPLKMPTLDFLSNPAMRPGPAPRKPAPQAVNIRKLVMDQHEMGIAFQSDTRGMGKLNAYDKRRWGKTPVPQFEREALASPPNDNLSGSVQGPALWQAEDKRHDSLTNEYAKGGGMFQLIFLGLIAATAAYYIYKKY